MSVVLRIVAVVIVAAAVTIAVSAIGSLANAKGLSRWDLVADWVALPVVLACIVGVACTFARILWALSSGDQS